MVSTRLATVAATLVLLVAACGGNSDEKLRAIEEDRDQFCINTAAALKGVRQTTAESRSTPALTPRGVGLLLHHAVVYCSEVDKANDVAWRIDDALEPALALAGDGDEQAREKAIEILDQLLQLIPARLRPER